MKKRNNDANNGLLSDKEKAQIELKLAELIGVETKTKSNLYKYIDVLIDDGAFSKDEITKLNKFMDEDRLNPSSVKKNKIFDNLNGDIDSMKDHGLIDSRHSFKRKIINHLVRNNGLLDGSYSEDIKRDRIKQLIKISKIDDKVNQNEQNIDVLDGIKENKELERQLKETETKLSQAQQKIKDVEIGSGYKIDDNPTNENSTNSEKDPIFSAILEARNER